VPEAALASIDDALPLLDVGELRALARQLQMTGVSSLTRVRRRAPGLGLARTR